MSDRCTLGNLADIEKLNLSHNQFTGSILAVLAVLYISGNMLIGCTSLQPVFVD